MLLTMEYLKENGVTPIVIWDSTLDLFESQYPVPEGISYNSYIVRGQKTALMDTVDSRGAQEWKGRVQELVDGTAGPDYLVVHHLEPDHSSQIEWVMTSYPECRLVCSATALRMMPQLVPECGMWSERIRTMSEGEILDLGGCTLKFVMAPMVHWPEVMMSYLDRGGILFSADAFGRFGNPDPQLEWACEARRYYFNIVGKYGGSVMKLFEKLNGLDIRAIAPLHGPVLAGDMARYMELYSTWASYRPEKEGVMVAYASIHGNTAHAARELAGMLHEAGEEKVEVVDLCRFEQSEAVEMAFELSKMVVMSATYDGNIFPPMHDFLHHLSLKGYTARTVAIVENGLWAPSAGRKMGEMLRRMHGVEVLSPIVTLRGRMTPQTRGELEALARNLADRKG